MASAHGHLNNEVMNNNRPPAPKFRKWLMRNNKSSLSGLIGTQMHRAFCEHNRPDYVIHGCLHMRTGIRHDCVHGEVAKGINNILICFSL